MIIARADLRGVVSIHRELERCTAEPLHTEYWPIFSSSHSPKISPEYIFISYQLSSQKKIRDYLGTFPQMYKMSPILVILLIEIYVGSLKFPLYFVNHFSPILVTFSIHKMSPILGFFQKDLFIYKYFHFILVNDFSPIFCDIFNK